MECTNYIYKNFNSILFILSNHNRDITVFFLIFTMYVVTRERKRYYGGTRLGPGTSSDRNELFCNSLHETRTKCLVPGDMFCLINLWLTQKHTGLKFLDPVWRFVVIDTRTVGTQTGARVSLLGPATETKSDWAEFMPV